MHSFPRFLLGWVNPVTVTSGTNAHITLYDSVVEGAPGFTSSRTDSTVCLIVPDVSDPTQYFILENRRRSSAFAAPLVLSTNTTYEMNPGSGLLITHVNTRGRTTAQWENNCPPWSLASHHLYVEPASGLWNSSFDPDPKEGRSRISADYRGLNTGHKQDVWKPSTSNSFTPYTSPSTHLFNATDSVQTVHKGLSILNISEGPDSSMSFDIKWSQPEAATAGSVTWKGSILLANDFTVSAGDTLKAGDNTAVLARGAGDLAPGGVDSKRVELKVEANAKLKIE